jgi:hypothetical protein
MEWVPISQSGNAEIFRVILTSQSDARIRAKEMNQKTTDSAPKHINKSYQLNPYAVTSTINVRSLEHN